tara:strand:- start:99 stop:371 length:273 start_codon:yes stop_codon:yes gene_type:complete
VSFFKKKEIEKRLVKHFSPTELLIKDQSHLHKNHPESKTKSGHFEIKITSEMFLNTNKIDRHRMIYKILDDLLQSDIHAIKIKALSPDDN